MGTELPGGCRISRVSSSASGHRGVAHIVCLHLCLLLVGCQSQPAGRDPHPQEPAVNRIDPASIDAMSARFQIALDELHREFGFPGATAAFGLDDGTVRGFAVGLADVENVVPMTADSRIMSASIGKTFVAATALALAHERKLTLDDRLEQWLGDEAWYERLPNGNDITLRQLLSHSAGIIDHVFDPDFRARMREMRTERPGRPIDRDAYLRPLELIEFALDKEPLFPAGRGYSYTDTGYLLVGLVIERAAGATYYEEVQRRFIEPLGLTLTEPSNRRQLAGLAAGYLEPDNAFTLPEKMLDANGALVFNPAGEWTGGGLITNSKDLVRWALALYGGSAIEGDYLGELLESGYRGEDAEADYGLAVYVESWEVGLAYGHGGWFPGYNGYMRYFPDLGLAIALQINRSFDNDRRLFAERLLAALLAGPESTAR